MMLRKCQIPTLRARQSNTLSLALANVKERRRRLYNTRQTPYNVLHGCHSTNYFEYKN